MGNILIEIEKNLTEQLIDTIDNRIEEVVESCNAVPDPDSLGHFDSIEHATGLGFVMLQTFMTGVYGRLGIKKEDALKRGPIHNGGCRVVKIVNDAANYWKHNNEWPLDRNLERQEAIKDTFDTVGFPVDLDYPLSGVLTELSVPSVASLNAVYQRLIEWKNELETDD